MIRQRAAPAGGCVHPYVGVPRSFFGHVRCRHVGVDMPTKDTVVRTSAVRFPHEVTHSHSHRHRLSVTVARCTTSVLGVGPAPVPYGG